MSDTIDQIRLHYRLAKSAETSRIRIDHGLASFARVYLTAWTPDGEDLSRKKANEQVQRVLKAIRKGEQPQKEDTALYAEMAGMVLEMEPAREGFENRRKEHRKAAEKLAEALPVWARVQHVRGFSIWGLCALVGEVGDISNYSGRRKLYKRLGLAPNECYETGEKKTGRKIPRNARGRIMGIIADALLRAQWRGEREDDSGCPPLSESPSNGDPAIIPAHPIGPYGAVYGDTKARKLAEEFTKGHADKYARRAMVKALLGDIWCAWHELPLVHEWAEAAE